jgi:hypothetical protein
MDVKPVETTTLTDRAKEPSSWLGAAVILGGTIGAAVGKPQLGDPVLWASVLNVISGIGLILTPQMRRSRKG